MNYRKTHRKGTVDAPSAFLLKGDAYDIDSGQPLSPTWTGYAVTADGDFVMKVGRSGGERSFDVALIRKR